MKTIAFLVSIVSAIVAVNAEYVLSLALTLSLLLNPRFYSCPAPTTTVVECPGCTGRPTTTVTTAVFTRVTIAPSCPTFPGGADSKRAHILECVPVYHVISPLSHLSIVLEMIALRLRRPYPAIYAQRYPSRPQWPMWIQSICGLGLPDTAQTRLRCTQTKSTWRGVQYITFVKLFYEQALSPLNMPQPWRDNHHFTRLFKRSYSLSNNTSKRVVVSIYS